MRFNNFMYSVEFEKKLLASTVYVIQIQKRKKNDFLIHFSYTKLLVELDKMMVNMSLILGRPIASITCDGFSFSQSSLRVLPCSTTIANFTSTLNETVSKN